ncbi:ubiquinone biosynthesis protein COQ9 [Dipodascopsis tothii]|uniref:ubiquinone biosynthesis protein COQ9 n=1 Tax=Dipodascopsis tothii TaxID=44089 RepID=UPI0034CD4070
MGFSKAALVEGCREHGYGDTARLLFPHGEFAIVQYHLYKERTRLQTLQTQVDAEEGPSQSRRVRRYCVERLRGNQALVGRLPEAFGLMAVPRNAPTAVEELALLADEIVFLSGDDANSLDWYAKRAGLGAVYAAAEVFMTQDRSAGFANTLRFLDARLGDLTTAGSFVTGAVQWGAFAGHSALNVLRSQIARG